MKSVLIAVDPVSEKGPLFNQFAALVGQFQSRGFFSDISVVSIMHSSLYAAPAAWYRKMKGKLEKEAAASVAAACEGKFHFRLLHVLHPKRSDNESFSGELSRFGRQSKRELLVVASQERKGLPRWILGSFSETAALAADMPVLVLKPGIKPSQFSKEVRFLLAVDAAAPPAAGDIRWLARAAKLGNAKIDLVYVVPKPRIMESLRERRKKKEATPILRKLQHSLRADGVKAEMHLLRESRSIADTIAKFADDRKSWVTVMVETKRSTARKILLGSTARRLITITKRPFLSLRFG